MRLLTLMLALFGLSLTASTASAVTLASPDGAAAITIAGGGGGAPPHWQVAWRGRPMLEPALLALRLAGSPIRWRLGEPVLQTHDTVVTGLLGRASTARDRYRELTIPAGRAPGMAVTLVVRAYDDAVAYRWRIVGDRPLALAGEEGAFHPPATARLWALPLPGFTSSYENFYRVGELRAVARGAELFGLPLLFRVPGAGWGAITEAALDDWAGLYLAPSPTEDRLTYRLSPRPDKPALAVRRAARTNVSPWRVVLLGDDPGRLIESNAVTLLNPPPTGDWSWVRPGKTLFPWWNDYHWPGAPFTPGLNTATYLALIDFAGKHGIPFVTLDGYKDQAWYGGPIAPDGTPQDLTRARPEIDMAALVARARARGVSLRVWVHWQPFAAQTDAALAAWARWGIAGVMVDFMDRDDQAMVALCTKWARKAAAHHMTISYHGAFKPTGEIRTWPNMLTREGVRNAEYNKFADKAPNLPGHEATFPFVRMLAGPLDTHQGGFNHAMPETFRTRATDPFVFGTRARALALYIVEENPLPMLADSPARYAGAAGFDFAVATPEIWNETRVLHADPGHALVIARRRGAEWWIGAITDEAARTLRVSLARLGAGPWRSDEWRDRPGHAPAEVDHHTDTVAGTLTIAMDRAGGYAARLTPLTPRRTTPPAAR